MSAAADAAHRHVMAPDQAELGAQAAFDASGVLWAVHRVSGHIAVSRSADEGQSWSNAVLVTRTPEAIDAGGDARPKIALGPKGEIYVSWTRPLAEPYTGEIRFSRSLDAGRTFSPPIVVHHDRQVITHRFDTIAVNQDGEVFAAWIDKRDLVASTPSAYRGAALYYAVSSDQGASFRGDFKVADHCCECCRLALVSHRDGTVTAFWRHIFDPNIRDHAIANLRPDGHAEAVQRATFEDWRIDACPHHGPAMAIDGDGALHGVWFSGAARNHGVFYGRLSASRGDAAQRIGADSAGHAAIGATGRRIAIAWKEYRDGRTALRGLISEDAGHTWRPSELSSAAGLSDHPSLLTHNGRFFAFWNSGEHPLAVIPFP
ncbi:hypothetical protein DB354_02260 [Opitutus sp. ER46]|nr:hypothetical protein DB354_02260 [Opitutus sp. ER46]